MKHLQFFTIIIFIMCLAACQAHAQPGAVSPAQETIPTQWQLNVNAPQVKTELVAFLIQGKRRSDQIYVPDMDILITKDNKRLIPLLRFLRLIEARGEMTNDMVIFKLEDGKLTPLDIVNKTLQVNGEKIQVDIEVGVSDVTNNTEIYISEEILRQAFGFDFTWDQERLEYKLIADKELEIFKRRRMKVEPISLAGLQKLSESLPETEPPAHPKKHKDALSFFQTEARADVRKQLSKTAQSDSVIGVPSVNLWGNLLNGDYKARLRREMKYPDLAAPTIAGLIANWVDNVVWTLKSDSGVVNVGDANIGFSDLVGPAVNLTGATFKWFPGAEGDDKKDLKNRFLKMSRPGFLNEEKFEGYAPLGAEVSLYVNNRLVASKKVEESDDAPVGSGYYNFSNIGLWTNSINDIKIVTKREDQVVEEERREILSVNQLLPSGQFALLGGTGAKRYGLDGETRLEGNFSGLQAFYGFSKDLTLGFTAAMQDKFSTMEDELTGEYYTAPKIYYIAQEARWRIFNRLFGKYTIAANHDPLNSKQTFASKAEFEYYMKRAKLNAQVFSYDPGYSNGVTSISDRQGLSLYGDWQVFEKLYLKSMLLHVFNNVKGTLENTKQEDRIKVGAKISGVIPRSTLEVQAAYMNVIGDIYNTVSGTIYSAQLQSTITDKLDLDIYYAFGDQINRLSQEGLSYGLSLPGSDSFYSYNSRIRLNYRVNPSLSLSSAYYNSYTQDRAELSASYNSTGKYHWRSRLDAGADLKTIKPYLKNNLELELDKNGDNRVGIRAGISDISSSYDVGFYVTLKKMFAMKEGRIDDISGVRIYPERGGIQGTVYMDLNCNGHRDKGEPGVPNIAILLDDRQYTESDKDGDFYISKRDDKNFVTVSLDMNSLPAIYTPTQGIQKAHLEEGAFTPVNLGVCALGAVSGTVKLMDNGDFAQNARGLRVILMQEGQDIILKDSVTAYDGSFYIGQIKPGDYILTIDKATLQETYEPGNKSRQTIHLSASAEPVELEGRDIYLNMKKIEVPPEAETQKAQEEKAPLAGQTMKPAKRDILSYDLLSAEENAMMDKVHKTLQYIYSEFTNSKYSVGTKADINLTL